MSIASTLPYTLKKSCLRREGQRALRKKVWFDYVDIREYPMILGDNPTTTAGVPITIGWRHQGGSRFEVEYFELYRRQRRSKAQLLLSVERRASLSMLGGSTFKDIFKVAIEMAKIQSQRAASSQKTPLELLREGLDRRLRSPIRKKRKMILKFTKMPTEAPLILSSWREHGAHLAVSPHVVNPAA